MKENVIGKNIPKGFIPPCELSHLQKNTPILVGFSGGADSSALLHMLVRYGKDNGTPIYAAHVNHGIRGEEADRDQRFCEETAEKLGVTLFSTRLDIPSIAKEEGKSVETAARDARYAFFEEIMKKHSIPLLATAHNANDNLETILFNLARGCGLSGICGIPLTRNCSSGIVIRPIIKLSKEEILVYCKENNISYVTDSTNTDTKYTRNKIRSDIIPLLNEINMSAVESAGRTSESLRDDLAYLNEITEQFLSEACEDKLCTVDAKKIANCHVAIANRAIMTLYSKMSNGNTLENIHVRAIREFAEKAVPHSSLDLPHKVCAVIENGMLCFVKREELVAIKEKREGYFIELHEGENPISQTKAEIIIGNSHSKRNVYKKFIQLHLDSATINGAVFARERRAGDKICINGMSKSLKKMLCDLKIPLEERSRLPIIFDENGILAVPFVAIRDGAKHKSGDLKEPLVINFYLY
ncbi:MAG: tRNA lysidine(34) synthetase TilS [Clostridia bacterium]|nr:tRNA lysidine(34) synthetase TilS [Clostridia bacterium]